MEKTTINKNSRGDFPVLSAFWLDDSYLPVCFHDPHQQLASFLVCYVSCVTCATWYPVCKLEFSLFSFLFQLWSKVSHLINRSAVQREIKIAGEIFLFYLHSDWTILIFLFVFATHINNSLPSWYLMLAVLHVQPDTRYVS